MTTINNNKNTLPYIRCQKISDINGDGYNDQVNVTWAEEDQISRLSVRYGDGLGNFTRPKILKDFYYPIFNDTNRGSASCADTITIEQANIKIDKHPDIYINLYSLDPIADNVWVNNLKPGPAFAEQSINGSQISIEHFPNEKSALRVITPTSIDEETKVFMLKQVLKEMNSDRRIVLSLEEIKMFPTKAIAAISEKIYTNPSEMNSNEVWENAIKGFQTEYHLVHPDKNLGGRTGKNDGRCGYKVLEALLKDTYPELF